MVGFGVISPCLAREAIPQLAGLTELVSGDQGMSSVARVRRVPRKPIFCFVLCTLQPLLAMAMTSSQSTRIYPLSEQQERRLLDYLDRKYLEIHQEFSRRSAPNGVTRILHWLTIFLGMNPNPNFLLFRPTSWQRERCLH